MNQSQKYAEQKKLDKREHLLGDCILGKTGLHRSDLYY